MRQRESVPVPRGWTGRAAWKGTGASLLLHLFVGAAAILTLSGSPGSAPPVIDLTLLPSAGIDRGPVPPAFSPAESPGKAAVPEPPAAGVPPAHAERPADATTVSLTGMAAPEITPDAGTGPRRPAAPFSPSSPVGATTGSPLRAATVSRAMPGEGGGGSPVGNPSGNPGAGSPTGDFAYVRDAIQRGIVYPAAARKMGWEGQVMVAFRLLPDGSVRDVQVVQGSGYAALDRGAIDAVRNASPFPRSPDGAKLITPVVYRLTTR
ncbi:MAG: energy transducer TonB [bacterium]